MIPFKDKTWRIGFDAKRVFTNRTGLGNYSRFVISSLIRYYPNIHCYLFTPKMDEEWNELFQNEKNVTIITPQSLLGKSFKTAWRTFALRALIDQYQLDAFHGLSNELPIGIESFSGKKIVTIHDLIFLRYPDYYSNIDRYIYTKKFQSACLKADLVIATSQQTRSDIIQFFNIDPAKVQVIYQDCGSQFEQPINDSLKLRIRNKYNLPESYMLCVGTIEQRKNQLSVLKAFHEVALENKHLVFVGKETNYSTSLHQYIEQNQLQNLVTFIPHVEANDLPAFFQMTDLFIYASEFEGFGIPVIEAYKSKVPVLLAKSSSLIELGNEQSAYFDPFDIHQLSDLMKYFSEDQSASAKLVENGSTLLQRFNPQQLTEQLIKVYIS